MDDPVDTVLAHHGRVATRVQLLRVMSRGRLDHLVRRGELCAPFRGAFCRPWDLDDSRVRRRAALVSVGPPATLSHLTALEMRELMACDPCRAIHLTTPAARTPRARPGLMLHRARHFPDVTRVDGLISVTVADAVVTSWPLLARAERRGPAIRAVRERSVSLPELRAALDRYGGVPGRRELSSLLALLEAGCESELEIWGHTHVFDVPGLRHGARQRVVTAGGRRYRLEIAFDDERVAVELDGWAYHSTREQRERDLRRDAALAAAGWLTVRFTHRRLTTDIDGCRRELLAILAGRRRL